MTLGLGGTARFVVQVYVPSVLMGFGLGMLLPTVPALARAFGVAPDVAAQAITALLVGRVAYQFPAGYVVDTYGPRAAMVGGLVAGASHAGVAFGLFAPLHLVSGLVVLFVARESLGRARFPRERDPAAAKQ